MGRPAEHGKAPERRADRLARKEIPRQSRKKAAGGCQRPKSREETPKEGGGNTRESYYRAAIRYTALHKRQEGRPKKPSTPWRRSTLPSRRARRILSAEICDE